MLKFLAVISLFSVPAFSQEDPKPVPGGLDKAVIDEQIRQRLPLLRGCYDSEVKKKGKSFAGSVSMRFVIGSDGRVSEVKGEGSTLNSPEMEECMVSAIKAIEFPRPAAGGAVEVSYPFAFSPKAEGKESGKKKK